MEKKGCGYGKEKSGGWGRFEKVKTSKPSESLHILYSSPSLLLLSLSFSMIYEHKAPKHSQTLSSTALLMMWVFIHTLPYPAFLHAAQVCV